MQERLHTVVFGLFTLLTENVMLDYVFNSRRQSVQFLIFSKNYEKIASAIGSTTHHGVTILDGYGWFTNTPTKVLFVLARKRESQYIFRLIKYVDPHAFVSQSAVIGVFGNGFERSRAISRRRCARKWHWARKPRKQPKRTIQKPLTQRNRNPL